jgi:hypothetical protein
MPFTRNIDQSARTWLIYLHRFAGKLTIKQVAGFAYRQVVISA